MREVCANETADAIEIHNSVDLNKAFRKPLSKSAISCNHCGAMAIRSTDGRTL
jgi:hypothetical protein